MRLLFCNYEYPPLGGGGGVVNAALAAALAKRHEVTVLTSRGPGLEGDEIVDGVRVVRVPVLFRRSRAVASFASMLAYLGSGALAGRRLLAGRAYDVINTHFVLPTGPVGHALSRIGGVPNVLSVHGGDLFDPSKRSSAHRHAPLRALVRHLALAADAVVAQSQDTRDNLNRFYAPEIRPHVIPLGIAAPPRVSTSRAAHGVRSDDVVLIGIGRLVARKRFDRLIAAVAMLDPRVKLLIVGEGPKESELRDQAARMGVADRVRFCGAVDDVTKYELLSISDLYVSTSDHEGFGLVFLEAMASGLPIVCGDRGGQRDFLVDGVTGYLVPPDDISGFVERCTRLIARPEERLAMGNANRARASSFFIDRCAERYEELFEAVVREHRRRAGSLAEHVVEGTK
ncbi:MAG: glycosyltransferase family 4 protein [Gammaproteobacteria bacterium]